MWRGRDRGKGERWGLGFGAGVLLAGVFAALLMWEGCDGEGEGWKDEKVGKEDFGIGVWQLGLSIGNSCLLFLSPPRGGEEGSQAMVSLCICHPSRERPRGNSSLDPVARSQKKVL